MPFFANLVIERFATNSQDGDQYLPKQPNAASAKLFEDEWYQKIIENCKEMKQLILERSKAQETKEQLKTRVDKIYIIFSQNNRNTNCLKQKPDTRSGAIT